MLNIRTALRRGWSSVVDKVDDYFSYIRNNNKNYFKFKEFSQIQTFGDKLIAKPDGYIHIWFENINRLPLG